MKVTVRFNDEERVLEFSQEINSYDILREVGLYPDGVLIMRHNTILPEDEILTHGDVIDIIKISSGG